MTVRIFERPQTTHRTGDSPAKMSAPPVAVGDGAPGF
jgi:hypothetical protein